MFSQIKIIFLAVVIVFAPVCVRSDVVDPTENWQEQKSAHFIIHFTDASDTVWAQQVLSKAEYYYTAIAQEIGYSRYSDFWTWDNRVNIYVYPDQETFTTRTGQPSWSTGAAIRDTHAAQTRLIITFKQEENFLDGLLPHEMTHLMLHDYVGPLTDLPLWFDEGLAQMQEEGKAQQARQLMRQVVAQQSNISFAELMAMDIRHETDTLKVATFYAESISILDFLISKYSNEAFGDFCVGIREGKNFNDALVSAYRAYFDSWDAVEKKWLTYMQN